MITVGAQFMYIWYEYVALLGGGSVELLGSH
jgi:hypothetical protein